MKKNLDCFKARALDVAVRSALISVAVMAGAAYAEDAALPAGPTVEELVKPSSHIELGGLYVGQDSYKQGEYNGLESQGMHAIANVDLSGGGAYDSGDATRYRVIGTDLGLDTRRINLEYGKQGSYRIDYLHDEQRRNYTDDYKTLWNGAGSDTLTLPAGYPAIGTRVSSTSSAAAALANWNNIQAPNALSGCTANPAAGTCLGPGYLIPTLMHNVNISTKRTIDGVVLNWNIAEGWEARASYRHEEKKGIKLTGVNMNRFSGPSALLPEPIDSSTNIYEATVGYANAKGHFSIGYNGSLYNNDTDMWTAQYAGAPSTLSGVTTTVPGGVARMSGAPDNEMHQITLAGSYNFTEAIRLVMNAAYTRMTQDDNFLSEPASAGWILPENSAHAKVNNSFFNAKLTTHPMDNVGLNFAYKYDYRNNKTRSHEFKVTPDTAMTKAGSLPTDLSTLFENEPINRRLQQFNVDADYAFAERQGLNLGYEWQEIKRTADTEESPFRAEKTWENTLSAEYRNNLRDNLTGRVSYAYSQRHNSHYEPGDPMPTSPAAPLPAADPLLPGFKQFFLADRNQNKLKGSLDFQATDALVLQTGGSYSRDDYNHSQYGLQDARNWTINLDADYAANENLSINAFYTYEDIKAKQRSYAIARGVIPNGGTLTLDPHTECAAYTVASNHQPADYFEGDSCRNWSQTQSDHVHTLGVGFKSKGLLQGKFELSGDLAYSYAKTPIEVNGSSYFSDGNAPAGSTHNVVVQAQDLPDITTRMLDVKLNGVYALNKQSSVRVNYIYRHLTTSDWQYDAYTNSDLGVLAVQSYLGPGISSPDYSVHMLGVSYVYNFK